MKKLILIPFIFASLMITGCVITSETTSTTVLHHPNSTFSDLDRYGTWVDISDYGTVWKPFDEVNWQPYTDGQWVWTDQGWMWDSNEPYGWIVYHYGYWQYTDYDGWFWIPGYDWAPERVRWYHSNGYVGWAPAPPPTVDQGEIYNDVYVRHVWIVVPEQNFAGDNIVKYRNRENVPPGQTLRSNSGGRAPNVRNIENVSHRTIDVVRPTREEINSGNRQLTRVRIQNNAPVSPATIRNQTAPVRTTPENRTNVNPQTPAARPPENNDRRPTGNNEQRPPVRTTPANPPNVSPKTPAARPPENNDRRPTGNNEQRAPVRTTPANPSNISPKTPAARPPEINDRRPVNNHIQRTTEERNIPNKPIVNPGGASRQNVQGKENANNPKQKNAGVNPAGRKPGGTTKQPAANPANVPAVAPDKTTTRAPVRERDKKNTNDKKDDKKENQ
jgi:hypothetical protein